MSSSAPQTPRRSSTPSGYRSSLSPSLLRIPYLVSERARSLTPSRTIMTMPIRRSLPGYSTFDDAVDLLYDSNNIVVLAGAGISTSVGIPDFRSAQGLYNQVRGRRNFSDPQQLFEPNTFLETPQEFWEDVKPIIPKVATAISTGSTINSVPRYGPVHSFLHLLHSKDKLLQTFTQNIDGLELAAGVPDETTVRCHGSWDTATCITCDGKINANEYLPAVHDGLLPLCSCSKPATPDPDRATLRRGGRQRKEKVGTDTNVCYLETLRPVISNVLPKPGSRSSGNKRKRRPHEDEDTEDAVGRPGLLKPDITFFGEPPSNEFEPSLEAIKNKIDLLIIIGTSLPVEPVNLIPFEIPANVPQVWISKERCQRKGLAVDVELIGECGLVVEELCRRAGWTNAFLNRLWRNSLGSSMQGKEAMKAKMAAAVASSPEKVKFEQPEQLALRPAKQVQGNPTNEKKERREKQAVATKVKVELEIGSYSRWLVKEL